MPELYIGLISGTSMDGIDTALVDFTDNNIKLIATHNHSIPETTRANVFRLAHNDNVDLNLLGETDAELGELFADAALTLLSQTDYLPGDIKAIGSHGQTIWHNPAAKHKFSIQITDANRIAYKTGITTVADFRRKDMAAGGEGAPLASGLHKNFFSNSKENRAVLNIGGISNLTYLPANKNEKCFGFDCGPGNVLMDGWIARHHGKAYDANGKWASQSDADEALVKQLMTDDYIHLAPPKSTGREHYHMQWLDRQLKGFSNISADNVQTSLCAFTANSIHHALEKHLPAVNTLIVCGGGAHNQYLMRLLSERNPSLHVASSEQFGLSPDWVEATAFAWMAQQTLLGKPSNLPDVTGAKQPVTLGAIYPV